MFTLLNLCCTGIYIIMISFNLTLLSKISLPFLYFGTWLEDRIFRFDQAYFHFKKGFLYDRKTNPGKI
jgi:hypothetical protein